MSFYDILKAAKVGGNLPSYYETLLARKLPCSKFAWQETTLSGVPPLSFSAKGTALSAYSVTGNLSQTGTPTPAQPIVPEECGDVSENMFDKNNFIDGGNFYPAAGDVLQDSSNTKILLIPCEPNTTYTISRENAITHRFSICFVDSKNLYAGMPVTGQTGSANAKKVTSTSAADSAYMIIYYGKSGGVDSSTAAELSAQLAELMVNVGSDALPYVPHWKIPLSCSGTTYPIYLQEPLRKIGDYADSVDSSGVVTRRIRKLVLDGTETGWTLYEASEATKNYFYLALPAANLQDASSISTHFEQKNIYTSTTTVGYGFYAQSGLPYVVRIRPDNVASMTKTDWTTWLSAQYANGTPVTVWYVLASPVTETVTCPTITPASGSNTLSCGTTLAPSSVSLTGKIKEV